MNVIRDHIWVTNGIVCRAVVGVNSRDGQGGVVRYILQANHVVLHGAFALYIPWKAGCAHGPRYPVRKFDFVNDIVAAFVSPRQTLGGPIEDGRTALQRLLSDTPR